MSIVESIDGTVVAELSGLDRDESMPVRAEFRRRHAAVRRARRELAGGWQELADLKRGREREEAVVATAAPTSDMLVVAVALAGLHVLDRAIADQRAEVARLSVAAHLAEQYRDALWDADPEPSDRLVGTAAR